MNTESFTLPVFSLGSSAPETLSAEYHEVLKKVVELQQALGAATLSPRDFPDDGYAWEKAREERIAIYEASQQIGAYVSAWVEHALDAELERSNAS